VGRICGLIPQYVGTGEVEIVAAVRRSPPGEEFGIVGGMPIQGVCVMAVGKCCYLCTRYYV
jgi:hypothetical protein